MSNTEFNLLLNNYNKLPNDSRALVQLCGVNRERVPFNKLMRLTNIAFGAKHTTKYVKSAVKQLVNKELLVKNRSNYISVNEKLSDYVVQDSIRNGQFESFANVSQSDGMRESYYYCYEGHIDPQLIRDMRIAYYLNDVSKYNKLRKQLPKSLASEHGLLGVLEPFDSGIFSRLEPSLQEFYLIDVMTSAVTTGVASQDVLKFARNYFESKEEINEELLVCILDMTALMGDLEGLCALDKRTNGKYPEILGCEEFLRGEWLQAEYNFNAAIARIRKETRKRNVAIRHIPGIFHALLLLREDSSNARAQLEILLKQISAKWPIPYRPAAELIRNAMDFQTNVKVSSKLSIESNNHIAEFSLLSKVIAASLSLWFQPEEKLKPAQLQSLKEGARAYKEIGFRWIAAEALSRVSSFQKTNRTKSLENNSQQIHSDLKTVDLSGFIAPVAAWTRSLNALEKFGSSASSQGSEQGYEDERLIWEITYDTKDNSFFIVPIIQKITKRGVWSKGRVIKMNRILNSDFEEYEFLTAQDKTICKSLSEQCYDEYWYAGDDAFDESKVATALAGHPAVFRKGNRSSPVEILIQEPQLVISESKESSIKLELQPTLRGSDVKIIEDGPRRLIFVQYSFEHNRLIDILGEGGLTVPSSQQARVMSIVQSVASTITVHSHIGADAGEVIDADAKPHIHLLPYEQGVQVEFFVQPLGLEGPFYRPCSGGESVIIEIDGKKISTRRDFTTEHQLATETIEMCSVFCEQFEKPDSFANEFVFSTSEEALELMLQLQPLVDEQKVVLHWPRGEKFSLYKEEVGCSQFSLNISSEKNWFKASGNLKVDEELSLDLLKLLKLFELNPSRFIPLDNGQFLALTKELRSRVEELAAYSEPGEEELRFPSIRVAALGDLEEVFQVAADEQWKESVSRITDSMAHVSSVPSTFRGELRDYQLEGFQWLCRLARWGVGACLADDMGLGKTIQALALMLERASGGPTLILAPTSVCFNWVNEISRFAPTLNAQLFGEGDRHAAFENLGQRDVVVCSWGLLHREQELMQSQNWHTAVLDEAQLIKNANTERSKAAMGLQADFRLIMTGTPLENHLGELWNLFNFINPGLLGSRKFFHDNFSIPIERHGCKQTQQRLKKLIQPFILRRTKTKVLDELPARTEITIQVEMSENEAALYEALRKQALERLENPDSTTPKYLRIFAELMRLRRVCCHPTLVMPEANVASSKLALFLETIDELLDNSHKVLVFSQFVGHLKILKEALIEKGVEYKYLDGSTPARERKCRVEAFQAGEGDVFLISLKAGGLGLNLTAADYVLHMDPWWNPAVEDQASDRAHRLGQQRPVTIYRFVTKGTIEERIVKLHATKRDLADTLLQGTDMSSKLSAEELLTLMQQ